MKKNRSASCHTLILFASLLLFAGNPVWANEADSGAKTVVVENGATAFNIVQDAVGVYVANSENIHAKGVGAIVAGGFNQASGLGVQLDGISDAQISGIGAVAIGNYNTAVGTGVQMINSTQNGSEATALQSGNNQTGYGAMAVGTANTAMGSNAWAVGVGNTAVGFNSQATAAGSVALGAGSIASQADTVSVGRSADDAGGQYNRRITNMAPGVYGTDAVNVNQLRSVDAKVDRVGASAAAFSALAPLPYDPKEPTQYSAGIGTYNGTAAFAVGVYHYTKPDVMLNAAIGISNDGWEKQARVGISWRTGGAKAKEIAPAVEPKESIVDRVKKILDEDSAE